MDAAARLAPALAVLALLAGPGPAPTLPPHAPGGSAVIGGTAADDPPPLTPVRDPTPAEPPPPQDTLIGLRPPTDAQRA